MYVEVEATDHVGTVCTCTCGYTTGEQALARDAQRMFNRHWTRVMKGDSDASVEHLRTTVVTVKETS